ncbi:MAG: hypothetical protein IJO52_01895, partial [Clostridia bacterium]|nr:hypothetical protein [Clostridia bacterium]
MKKLSAILSAVLLSVLCVLFVSAAEDYILWDFSVESDAAQWKPSSTTTVTVTPDGAVIAGEGNDINLKFTPSTELYLDDYKYVVVEYCGATVGGTLQFYHWTEGCTGNPRFESKTQAGDKTSVKQHKIDLSNPPATANWSGKVTSLRIDPFRGTEPRELTLKYIGFFKDQNTFTKFTKAANEAEIVPGQPVVLFNPSINNVCFPTAGTQCTLDFVDNYAVVTSFNGPGDGGNGDPQFSVPVEFDGDKWHWMKIRLRNLSEATQFELHFAAEGNGGKITGSSCTHFPISTGDADFVEYIVDLKAANMASQSVNGVSMAESVWSGYVTSLRLDCMWKAEPSGQMPTGSQMYIDYVAIFSSEEDAKNYTPDPSTEIEQPKKNTGAATPIWIFDNEEIVKDQSIAGADVMYTGGMLRMLPNGSDPIMTLKLDVPFDTEEFPIFAYRHNTTSKVSTLGVFYSTDSGTDLSASYSPVTIANNGSWSNTIVDLSDLALYPKGTWSGNVTQMRIDPINGLDEDAVIYIDRLGFFRTTSEAYEFLSQGRSDIDYSESSSFRADLQKSIVPANT